MGHGTRRAGDVGGAEQAQQGDGEVAQGRHDGGSAVGANSGAVLVEGDIAHVVGAVLDAPVAAAELEQAFGGGLFGGQVGDEEHGLGALFARFEVGDVSFETTDLGEVGEIEVLVEGGGGAEAAVLEATVAFIEGFAVQGENAPG